MNEAMKNIYERRSCRNFLPHQITKSELVEVLNAGMQAPSAMNQQSWFMVAVQDATKVEQIRKICVNACNMPEEKNPFYHAPTIILVFGKEGNIAPEKDASMATLNMMLAAQSLGLATCWINCVIEGMLSEDGKALAKSFGVPDGYKPVGSLAIGLSAGDKPREKEVLKNYVLL